MIVGLGKTGYACAQYFLREGIAFSVVDDADKPAYLDSLIEECPQLEVSKINDGKLNKAEQIVLSPGVPLQTPAIQEAIRSGVSVTGDIEIFAQKTDKPFVGITGTNGKSTVTQLLGAMSEQSGKSIGLGGNIGFPSLNLLNKKVDFNILEISSYQLEVIKSLGADVAVLLNLSPDHLDRYSSTNEYYQTKLKIFKDCKVAVLPIDLLSKLPKGVNAYTFGMNEPSHRQELGIRVIGLDHFLSLGDRELMPTDELKLKGRHNWLNALAALAAGYALGLKEEKMLEALRTYAGLPHRCQWVGESKGVSFINDSKSTNPGSTQAAIEGLATQEQKLVLILGGQAKDANFDSLKLACEKHVKTCFVFGQDSVAIKNTLAPSISDLFVFKDLAGLMKSLGSSIKKGDLVLFSPACGSFDQFDNFEHRGEVYSQLVEENFL